MAIVRSIETRLIEAIRSVLVADVDIAALCNANGTPKIYIGPTGGVEANLIQPYQINLFRGPGAARGLGLGGVEERRIGVLVTLFAPVSHKEIVTGTTNDDDILKHIQILLVKGNGSYQGRFNDPDAVPGSPSLNTGIEEARIDTPRLVTDKGAPVAIALSIAVTVTSRENKLGVRA